MDVVPCHTSIEHPWFAEHPERYVWSDRDGPQNNWIASFGGPAWSRDPRCGRWYLHSFYPEQPDLDWRREDVRAAVGGALRFWLARGVDGFRLDAIDRLLKDPQLRDDPPASARRCCPSTPTPARSSTSTAATRRTSARRWRRCGGRRRRHAARRRGLPAGRAARAVPRARRQRLCLRAAARAVGGGRDPRRDRLRARPGRRRGADRLGALQPRLPAPARPRRSRATRAPRRCSRSRCRAPSSSTRATRSGWPTGRAATRRTTAPGATPTATRCAGTTSRRTAASRRRREPWLPAIAVDGGGVAQQSAAPDSVLALYRDLIARGARSAPA